MTGLFAGLGAGLETSPGASSPVPDEANVLTVFASSIVCFFTSKFPSAELEKLQEKPPYII